MILFLLFYCILFFNSNFTSVSFTFGLLTFNNCSKRISGFDMAPPASAMLAGAAAAAAAAAGTFIFIDLGLLYLLTAIFSLL